MLVCSVSLVYGLCILGEMPWELTRIQKGAKIKIKIQYEKWLREAKKPSKFTT